MKGLKITNCRIEEKDGKLIAYENDEGIKNEYNLITELAKYKNIDGLNLKINKARKSGAGRKPAFKYICPKCGKKFSSQEEDLIAKCVKCNENFQKQ